jgi:hypothetical protein
MEVSEHPQCQRCGSDTEYGGRISLPPQMIYRCNARGHQMWVQSNPPQVQPADQAQTQQQQQQQRQPEKHFDKS